MLVCHEAPYYWHWRQNQLSYQLSRRWLISEELWKNSFQMWKKHCHKIAALSRCISEFHHFVLLLFTVIGIFTIYFYSVKSLSLCSKSKIILDNFSGYWHPLSLFSSLPSSPVTSCSCQCKYYCPYLCPPLVITQ